MAKVFLQATQIEPFEFTPLFDRMTFMGEEVA